MRLRVVRLSDDLGGAPVWFPPPSMRYYLRHPMIEEGTMPLLTIRSGDGVSAVLELHPGGRVTCSRCATVVAQAVEGRDTLLTHICVPRDPTVVERENGRPAAVSWAAVGGLRSLPWKLEPSDGRGGERRRSSVV